MSQNPHFDFRGIHSSPDGDEVVQPPRRPKPETERRLLQGGPAGLAMPQAMKSESQLSVNAPVFVPMGYSYPGNQGPSYPLSGVQLSAGAEEFVPRSDFAPIPPDMPPHVGPPLQMPPRPLPAAAAAGDQLSENFGQMNLGIGDMEQAGLLAEFATTMQALTLHPANLRDFLLPLCEKLRQAHSTEVLDQVINILYEQSIYERNFRYTGARVCHFLCNELKNHSVFGNFKPKFLSKCQQDYNQREQLIKGGEDGMNRLCGLTLFMGELFLNVTADASGKERLAFLPSVLTDLLLTLLSAPSNDSVKTACQLLKLAGGPTEDAMQKTPQEIQNFNSIFTSLESLQAAPHISPNMKLMMKSVLNLRQSNWGRPDNRSHNPGDNSPASNVPAPDFSQSEPVFYNQYGKPITREEAGYHEEEEEETYEAYELTEEEEREFLIWQEEASSQSERLGMAPPVHGNHNVAQPAYTDSRVYQPWSTGDANYDYRNYPHNYDYNPYPSYGDDENFSDEMEKAYEEFLSSQRGPPMGK